MTEFEFYDAARRITDPLARKEFLDQACAGNVELRDAVNNLLNAPATGLAAFEAHSAVAPTIIGAMLPDIGTLLAGKYKLLENIGVGGMGTVWVAEQQAPVKRKVAVKLIKAGMDSRQVLARFEAERQALALMDHPNIAKVFDGGVTDQGHPFFVMEYVKGVPITDYCDRSRLSVKDRLKLFIPVCQAVQHAHHKGIVHRDLKPSNILVCLYDGHPVPKVIDFGLAKALHQPLTDQTLHTAHGLMLGTPLYMSPEQAEVNNLDVDTRTDIYSLGVVLYELLTGTTPLEKQQFHQAAHDEILRLIKHVEPPKPSTRLTGNATLPSIAAQRNIDPRQLAKSLTGDLDWIVMKSLDKERSRRYETANGFARDIERYLNEEAVEACPPSTAYRIRKFVKRYRGQVIAAAVVLLTLLLGITGTSLGMRWAWIAQQKTDEALETVKQERDQKDIALTEKTAALTAKEAALQAEANAREQEVRQRHQAERHLLQGIVRPIGYSEGSLETAELRSWVDWSALNDSRLQILGLELLFEDPELSLRVARRAERVIQAAVGLSPTRRAAALKLMSAKQRDRDADPRVRVAACWLALALGSTDLPAINESLSYLASAERQRMTEIVEFCEFLARHITFVTTEVIAPELIGLLDPLNDDQIISMACRCLTALAPRLSPGMVGSGCESLDSLLDHDRNFGILCDVVVTQACLASHLDAAKVTGSWDAMTAWLQNSKNGWLIDEAAPAMAKLVPHLNPAEISLRANELIAVLEEPNNLRIALSANLALVGLVPHLPSDRVSPTWNRLIKLLKTSEGDDVIDALGEVLVALAPRLDPATIKQSADTLIELLSTSDNERLRVAGANILAACSPRLESAAVTRAGEAIIVQLKSSEHSMVLRGAGHWLAAFGSRLEPVLVNEGWEASMALITGKWKGDSRVWDPIGEVLSTFASRVDAATATRDWDVLYACLKQSNSDYSLNRAAGKGLAALASRQDQSSVTPKAEALIKLLETSKNHGVVDAAWDGLAGLSPRLSPSLVHRLQEILLEDLITAGHAYDIESAEDSMSAVAPHMPSRERNQFINMALTNLADMFAGSDWMNEEGDRPADTFLDDCSLHTTSTDARRLAHLLSHPGCVSQFREALLQRFEELVLHDGRPVLTNQGDSDVPKPQRQFHTVYDAAAWIETNWPEFDLETSHPVEWRPTR